MYFLILDLVVLLCSDPVVLLTLSLVSRRLRDTILRRTPLNPLVLSAYCELTREHRFHNDDLERLVGNSVPFARNGLVCYPRFRVGLFRKYYYVFDGVIRCLSSHCHFAEALRFVRICRRNPLFRNSFPRDLCIEYGGPDRLHITDYTFFKLPHWNHNTGTEVLSEVVKYCTFAELRCLRCVSPLFTALVDSLHVIDLRRLRRHVLISDVCYDISVHMVASLRGYMPGYFDTSGTVCIFVPSNKKRFCLISNRYTLWFSNCKTVIVSGDLEPVKVRASLQFLRILGAQFRIEGLLYHYQFHRILYHLDEYGSFIPLANGVNGEFEM